MDFLQILRDSLHLLRTQKLVWVFGFLVVLSTLFLEVENIVRGNPLLVCFYLTLSFAISILFLVGTGSLIYVIHQATLNESPTFGDAWNQGMGNVFRMLSLVFLLAPATIIFLLIDRIAGINAPSIEFSWFLETSVAYIGFVFLGSVFIYGGCAIVIYKVNTLRAAWTGLLIILNNFFRILIIIGTWLIIRTILTECVALLVAIGTYKIGILALDYPTYLKIMNMPFVAVTRWIIDLILSPLGAVVNTLAFLQFTKKVSYPSLRTAKEVG